jgi:hypothetical protein
MFSRTTGRNRGALDRAIIGPIVRSASKAADPRRLLDIVRDRYWTGRSYRVGGPSIDGLKTHY